jgi:hypothetical protein
VYPFIINSLLAIYWTQRVCLTVLIRPITSPVAGHLVSTIGPDPFHVPSNTPGITPSEAVGRSRAERTREARVESKRVGEYLKAGEWDESRRSKLIVVVGMLNDECM